jgi:hypothetical protein
LDRSGQFVFYLIDLLLLPAIIVVNLTWRGPRLRRRLKSNKLRSKFQAPRTSYGIIVEESARLIIDVPFAALSLLTLWRFPGLLRRFRVMRGITRRELDYYLEVLWFDLLTLCDIPCALCLAVVHGTLNVLRIGRFWAMSAALNAEQRHLGTCP